MTQLQLAVAPAETDAMCDIVVSDGFPPSLESTLQEGLDVFARAANYGMFSGSRHEPTLSSIEPIPPPRPTPGERRRWSYRARAIDVGGYRVLFNILEHLCPESGDDLVMRVRGASGQPSRAFDSADLQLLAYPGSTAEASFRVDDNLKEPTAREVIVRVDFQDQLTEADTEDLSGIFDSWQAVVQRGGFPGPLEAKPGGALTLAEHYLVSPYLLEFAVYGYIGPVESYSALLNALHRVHRAGRWITGVELE